MLHSISSTSSSDASMMERYWLISVVLPLVVVTWTCTTSIGASLLAALFVPLLAILQGAIGIVRYRFLHEDAPRPLSPSHGVVVINPVDASSVLVESSIVDDGEGSSSACSCVGGGRAWRKTSPLSESEKHVLDKALREPPLRLLVIGDSLAIGIGTSQSCTPPLPEILARTLSKSLGGRAVYWTCHGEPGASAAWIVRELEHGIGSTPTAKTNPIRGELPRCASSTNVSVADTSISSSSDLDITSDSSSDEEEEAPEEWIEWRERLHEHRKRFDPHVLGPFDVAVVFSGANDLKSAFFPFLLKQDDAQLYKQAKDRGGNYADELRLVLNLLRDRMNGLCGSIMDRLHHQESATTTTKKQLETTDRSDTHHSSSRLLHGGSSKGPLIVLPGLPARTLPIFQPRPLRWIAIQILDSVDTHKRQLAESHSDEVLFVEPPTLSSIAEYESEQGPLWKQRESEDTLLSLRDVDRGTCKRIETAMREYYANNFEESKVPLSQRPGQPGSKIVSQDKIHPNDDGYEYWSRYIGSAIVNKWNVRERDR